MRAAEEMDQADRELRQTIKKIWPIQAKKNLNLIVPPDDGECTAEARQSVQVVWAAIRVSCRSCCPHLFRLVWMLPNTRIVTKDSYKLRVTGDSDMIVTRDSYEQSCELRVTRNSYTSHELSVMR